MHAVDVVRGSGFYPCFLDVQEKVQPRLVAHAGVLELPRQLHELVAPTRYIIVQLQGFSKAEF